MSTKENQFILKKWLLIGLAIITSITIIYFLFIGALLTGGYRDYKKFCTQYVSQLEKYNSKNMGYPASLSNFKKAIYSPMYNIEQCGYTKTEKGFYFIISEGLVGVAIYDSSTQEWEHD